MSHPHEHKARNYLKTILPIERAGGLESLEAVPDKVEAVLPAGPVPAGFDDAVASTAEKVVSGAPLERHERFALEAIIIPDKRPAVNIENGDYTVQHPLWLHLNDAAAKSKIRPALPSIGRIELPGHPSYPYGGTGFVVGEGRLLTNRHVAEIFCGGLGLKGLIFRPGHRAGIDFKREVIGGSYYFEVRKILLIHPYWDMAILEVEGLPAAIKPLRLSLSEPEELKGRDVAVVGYPAFDPRNDAAVQNQVFGGVYDVKRLMPGKLNGETPVFSFGKNVPSTMHDSSTLGGASGSAVIDVASGDVVALHFAGVYLESNYGVPTCDFAHDSRVVDTGLNFGGAPRTSAGPWDAWWKSTGAETVGVTVASSAAPSSTTQLQSPGEMTASWTIPLEVEVRLGTTMQGAVATIAGAASAVAIERAVEPLHEEDYANRKGYDPKFLGKPVPLPKVTDHDVLAKLEDGGFVIPYHHFSVVMHRLRRMALFTASNVDASEQAKKPEDGDYTRDGLGGLGDNDRERWFSDPRLRGSDQLPDRFFEKDNQAFDKGHLVRREDVAWGATYDEVRFANGDTFHTTNCSPQVAGFNRSNHKDNWGALEDLVLKQASSQKLSLFSGPVLSDDDRIFVGVDDHSSVRIQIPQQYWKVVVALDHGKLRTFAFLLRQNLSATPLEFVVPAAWEHKMIALSELEAMLGILHFPKVLHDTDQNGTPGGETVERAAELQPG
jgi:DNA/RNA endonuclease G (NUC1)